MPHIAAPAPEMICSRSGCILRCRMRVIARRTLRKFVDARAGYQDHSALKAALDAWFDEVRKASWASTAEVKSLYRSASILSSERIVFNIEGNDFRLVTAIDFEKGIVWIKWIGTHHDYDRIDAAEVQHERSRETDP
jgi:mRNA interferase HigB